MAKDDDDEFEPPDSIDDQRDFLYELIGFKDDDPQDREVRDLFWDVMYNDELSYGQRLDIYEQLSQYLQEHYGLDFQDVWDWESFREWYG